MKSLATGSRQILVAMVALTTFALALRLARYGQSIFGDEVSTFYVVDGRSLSQVLNLVSSDAEISPPLFFILSWLSTKLGSAPELVRLPSLIAGVISIPLVYLVGAQALNRTAGLLAAIVMTLTPTMIFYSADGRGYAVAIALLLGSTLAMLHGVRTGRTSWWGAYGALSLLAMYTHYTSAFVLFAQLGWLLWAHPEARKPALLANVAAVILYLPWLPGLLDDSSSPTVDVLSALQGDGFAVKRVAVEVWAVGYPFQTPHSVPGTLAAAVGAVGLVVGALASALRRWRRRSEAAAAGITVPLVPKGALLVLAIAVATPVFELLILLVTGNDLFGARNLTTSSAGLALVIGGILAGAGRIWGTVSTLAVVTCLAIAAGRSLGADASLPNTSAVATYVEERVLPGDVVLDLYTSPLVNPVPLSGLNAYTEPSVDVVNPLLPGSPPPFFLVPSNAQKARLSRDAFRRASGHRVFIVDAGDRIIGHGNRLDVSVSAPDLSQRTVLAPRGAMIVDTTEFGGVDPLRVTIVDIPPHPEQPGN